MNEQMVETAVDCVTEAGDILLDYHNRLHSLQIQAKGRFDYVTEADLAAQDVIIKLIHSRHPEHEILAEENNGSQGQNANRWLVDPLDGTANFIHGFPVFAVSVALEYENSIVVGAIYDPCRRELFLAQKGQGATLNGRPLQISKRKKIEEALVATAFPWRHKSVLSRYLEGFTQIFSRVSDVRRSGSAALDLAYVACGRCEGYFGNWD